MTKVQATFTSKRFADGSTVLTCRETGAHYSFNDNRHPLNPTPVFRDGQVIAYRKGRAPILGLIESDARWQIRDDRRRERAETTGHRLGFSC